jgi:hypothetical protein
MNRNTRIKLEDSFLNIAIKMSDSNPGALSVVMRVLKEGDPIDPMAMMGGGIATLLSLDMLGFYGEKIWVLYKYVCDHNLVRFMALIRANQIGELTESALLEAIASYGKTVSFNPVEIVKQMHERLGGFEETPAPSAEPVLPAAHIA